MKKLQKISILLFLGIIAFSCSVKKDKFLNRNYHALTTKYNILFNGEEAYKKGLKEIQDKHQDNFWKRLKIEPITFDEKEVQAPKFNTPGGGFDNNANEQENKNLTGFDKAEEKAVKAIQKHSMNIRGVEKNRQIDDAYLLLGKSRYYTQRFIPAIEAFHYVIENYPDANLINETKVWKAKTDIRLENEKLAIESLKYMIDVEENEEELPPRIKEQVHTAMAMAYEKLDSIEKVKEHLIKSAETFKNREQIARNLFILGQIYGQENKKDSARLVFNRIANFKKFPYKYRIHSNIELAKNTVGDSSSVALIKKLKKLVRDVDNRKYLDELYYQLGALEEGRNNITEAKNYYKKSLTAKNGSQYQKTFTYEKLGNIYFKKEDYLLAGSYYDSVAQVVPKEFENELRIRRIKRKNRGLTSLKKYETIVKNNDSILALTAMSKEEQTTFFEKYIEKIKKEDEERRQLAKNASSFGNSYGGSSIGSTKNQGKWYFYNPQSLGYGKAEFERVWGNRALEDNWRFSDKTTMQSSFEEEDDEEDTNKIESRYEVDTYLSKIPTTQKSIDSLTLERNDALYQLGLTYKEQFKNTKLATQNLERLLTVNSDKKLTLPINYHLFEIYRDANNSAKANQYKEFILTEYPNSQFAAIIKNPKKKLAEETKVDEVAKKYKEVFYMYKKDEFDKVITTINTFLPKTEASGLKPKFELLKAYAIGKLKNKETYKQAMEFVALTYANTEEGKKAQEIVNRLK